MLCEKCGVNNATTHIRTVVNGVVSEQHLCSKCALNKEYTDIKNSSLTQMLSNMLDGNVLPQKSKITRCNCCGSSFQDIANSGKCGCAECYTTFYNQLLPYLKRVHGNIQHIGKKNINSNVENQPNSVDELRDRLKKLIEEENYEQAAVVRDEIKKLQEGV